MNTVTPQLRDAGLRAAGLLPHVGVLRCAGPDAVTFLQGQLSNDVRRLAKAQTLLTALSTPQGRVVAVMHLLPHSTGILAVMPREVVLPTLERLRKFVMRAKVQIEDVSEEFAVAGVHDTAETDPDYAEGELIGRGRLGGAALRAATAGCPQRSWWVGPRAALEARIPAPEAADTHAFESAWRLADIRAGLAQIYLPTREMFVAQMLNLDLVDGISFAKGCYTGQEIIARTQHLGRIKRRLHRLRLPAGSWTVGQTVQLEDGRTGRLTEVVATEAGHEALVVLRSAEEAGTDPGDAPAGDPPAGAIPTGAAVRAVELALPYSLRPETQPP